METWKSMIRLVGSIVCNPVHIGAFVSPSISMEPTSYPWHPTRWDYPLPAPLIGRIAPPPSPRPAFPLVDLPLRPIPLRDWVCFRPSTNRMRRLTLVGDFSPPQVPTTPQTWPPSHTTRRNGHRHGETSAHPRIQRDVQDGWEAWKRPSTCSTQACASSHHRDAGGMGPSRPQARPSLAARNHRLRTCSWNDAKTTCWSARNQRKEDVLGWMPGQMARAWSRPKRCSLLGTSWYILQHEQSTG